MYKVKGFTLVELLVVIAILGALSATVAFILNPAELLRQARDSTRVSDLKNLNSSMALYLLDVSNPAMDSGVGACATAFYSNAAVTNNSFTRVGVTANTVRLGRNVNGSGWLPINLELISGGRSPLNVLPADQVNTGNFIYRYSCDDFADTYELNAVLESKKYKDDFDFDGKDGGQSTAAFSTGGVGTDGALIYELGNDPSLDL